MYDRCLIYMHVLRKVLQIKFDPGHTVWHTTTVSRAMAPHTLLGGGRDLWLRIYSFVGSETSNAWIHDNKIIANRRSFEF